MGADESLGSFKALAAFLTLAIAWAGVLLPIALRHLLNALSLARMLSVGVMLGGGLLHLLPDAAEELSAAFEFPVAYLLFALGLLLPLAVESLLLAPDAAKAMHAVHAREQWADLPDLSGDVGPPAAPDDVAHGEVRRDMPLSTAMVLLLALSFHSLLEGLAQGTARTYETGLVLLLAILAHKGLAAFALGCLFLDARLSFGTSAALGLLFALATPTGIVVGMALPAKGPIGALVASSFEAAAGGSFTYVALLEVLPRELRSRSSSVSIAAKLAMLAIGFGAMAALALVV